jgi:hypothetical protein
VAIKQLNDAPAPPTSSLAGFTAIDILFYRIEDDDTHKNDNDNDNALHDLRRELFHLSRSYGVDLFLQRETKTRYDKRLVVFDMDSTLIQQECIDEMARYASVEEEVKCITQRAMNGELDFEQSLRARVRLLRGQDSALLDWVIRRITLTPGVDFLCAVLKRLGVRLAVISGGFVPFATYIQQKLDLDYAFANTLEVCSLLPSLPPSLSFPFAILYFLELCPFDRSLTLCFVQDCRGKVDR